MTYLLSWRKKECFACFSEHSLYNVSSPWFKVNFLSNVCRRAFTASRKFITFSWVARTSFPSKKKFSLIWLTGHVPRPLLFLLRPKGVFYILGQFACVIAQVKEWYNCTCSLFHRAFKNQFGTSSKSSYCANESSWTWKRLHILLILFRETYLQYIRELLLRLCGLIPFKPDQGHAIFQLWH